MKTLNRRDFPGAQYPERIIQFGEGNFLRAFVDWQIDLLNEHTDLNSGVVVVRPIETSFPPSLSTQDGLYTTIIRGLNEKGEAVSDARLIRSVNREISVYSEYDEFLKHLFNGWIRLTASVLRWWTVSLPVIRVMKWLNWKKNWATTMVSSTPLNTFTCL